MSMFMFKGVRPSYHVLFAPLGYFILFLFAPSYIRLAEAEAKKETQKYVASFFYREKAITYSK